MVYFPGTANTGTILTMHIYTQSKDLISATSIHKINLIANLHLSYSLIIIINSKWEKWYFKTLDCLSICLEDIGGI